MQFCNSSLKEMPIPLVLQKSPSNKIEYHAFKKRRKKVEELSLLLSAVCLWVSFRAAFLLDSFRLESPTRTIKCGEMHTTFDLVSPEATDCWKQLMEWEKFQFMPAYSHILSLNIKNWKPSKPQEVWPTKVRHMQLWCLLPLLYFLMQIFYAIKHVKSIKLWFLKEVHKES